MNYVRINSKYCCHTSTLKLKKKSEEIQTLAFPDNKRTCTCLCIQISLRQFCLFLILIKPILNFIIITHVSKY